MNQQYKWTAAARAACVPGSTVVMRGFATHRLTIIGTRGAGIDYLVDGVVCVASWGRCDPSTLFWGSDQLDMFEEGKK